MKLLIDIEAPIWTLSRTERENTDPIRLNPKSETEDPNRANDLRANEDPMWEKS
jgi:hypothetical protein